MPAPVPVEAPRITAHRSLEPPAASCRVMSRHLGCLDPPCSACTIQQLLYRSLDPLVQAQEAGAVVDRYPPVAPEIDGLPDELSHADGERWRQRIGAERSEAEPRNPGPVAGKTETPSQAIGKREAHVGAIGATHRHRHHGQPLTEGEPPMPHARPPVDPVPSPEAAAAFAGAAGGDHDVLAARDGPAEVVVVAGEEAESVDQPS